jgi:hypothetical protein
MTEQQIRRAKVVTQIDIAYELQQTALDIMANQLLIASFEKVPEETSNEVR